MIIKITSKANSKIKDVVKLTKPSYQKEKGLFLAEGYHLFEMAKEEGLIDSVFTLKEVKGLDPLIPQYIIDEEILEKISSLTTPQGIITIVKLPKEKEISSRKILYLDDISDPGNMGTIFRTALAFGYDDIVITKGSVYPYSSKVIQASQGAIFKLNILTEDNYYLPRLKSLGYDVVVTYLKDAIDIETTPKFDKFVLVLGNEAHGVGEDVLSFATYKVKIDIKNIESLNVAIAGAIAMYTLK